MDVDAGMAAMQTGDFDAKGRSAGGGNESEVAASGGVESAGTADTERTDFFIVEIEIVPGFQNPRLEFGRAGDAGFVVDGEVKLERAVGEVFAFQDRESRSDTDAVIGAEGSAIGLEPIA